MSSFGRFVALILLTLGLLLLLVGLLSRFGVLADWGQQLADRRNALRFGGPFIQSNNSGTDVTPVALRNVRELLTEQDDLSTALQLMDAATSTGSGQADILTSLPQPTTLFMPSNDAFAQLPPEALAALQNNPDILYAILNHHIVRGSIPATEIVRFNVLPTLNGTPIPVGPNGNVGGANVLAVNQRFNAGLIHTIDRVLLPSNNLRQPVIDTPDNQASVKFNGDFLTVVGSAEPFTRVVLNRNGEKFGEVAVSADGSYRIENSIDPGTHQFIAYMLNSNPDNPLPLGISTPIEVIVQHNR